MKHWWWQILLCFVTTDPLTALALTALVTRAKTDLTLGGPDTNIRLNLKISKSLKMSADKTYWHTRRDTRGLWVVASPVSSLLRLTASSTTVLWSTGSRLEERPRPRQRRTRGPGEGDITGQDWSRGIEEHRLMSGSHGHWLRSQIMKLLSRKTLTSTLNMDI